MTRSIYLGAYPASGGPSGHDAPGFDGAGVWQADLCERSGRLSGARSLVALESASFLALGALLPAGERVVHVAIEAADGAIASIALPGAVTEAVTEAVTGTGRGRAGARVLGMAPSGGAYPCHLLRPAGAGYVLAANYGDGTLGQLPLTAGGAVTGRPRVFRFEGGGPDAGRQEGPHAHFLAEMAPGLIALADLGSDAIRFFHAAPDGLAEAGMARLAPGTGPRHLAVHPSLDVVYVTAELSGEVLVLRREGTGLTELQRLPASAGPQENLPSHLALSPAGHLLYVANRGPGTLSAFTVGQGGTLAYAGETACQVSWPRHFAALPASDGGDWLLVAGQSSRRVTVLHRPPGQLVPSAPAGELSLPGAPVCVLPGA